jgi:hypothetical protein
MLSKNNEGVNKTISEQAKPLEGQGLKQDRVNKTSVSRNVLAIQ